MIIKKWLIRLTLLASLMAFSACGNALREETPALSTDNLGETEATNSQDNPDEDAPDTDSDSTAQESTDSENTTDQDTEAESYFFDNLEFKTLDGETAHLYDYEGEIIILNFWATWCKYCVEEMPLLDALNEKEGYTVLAVDVGEDESTVRDYVESYGYTMPIMLDEDGALASQFGVTGFPTSLFIGPDFEYYYSYPGMLEEETLNDILEAIDQYQSTSN